MKEKIENEEIKEYLIDMATSRLQSCDVFTRTFGKNFASTRLKNNLCKVYTNEINKKHGGYTTISGEEAFTITICCESQTNEPLSVEQIEDDFELQLILLHEAIHIILAKTKLECIKTSIESGTGLLEQYKGSEIGRGLNEGLTNWIVRKTGLLTDNSYLTLTNLIEELELAVGEDNVMAMGKGNISRKIPKLLKINFSECLKMVSIGDEIYKIEEQIFNVKSILDITTGYKFKDDLNQEEREEVEKQYKKLIEGEYFQEELSYQKFLADENKTDTPENRRDFFENQLQEKESRHIELKSQFESIIYEKYFKNEFEQVIKSGMNPHLPQLRKWENLWNLITEEGVKPDTPISEFQQKYEEMRKRYLDNISLEAKEEFNNGKLSGKQLVELLNKSSGIGNNGINIKLLSTVAQLIAPNPVDEMYVLKLLESLNFEQLEHINQYKISTYCAGDMNIPVCIKNGKIISIFLSGYEEYLSQMKITSEKELEDENSGVFDYTIEMEKEDGYTSAREEALQIYEKALKKDSKTKMKILNRMIVLESGDGTQTPYIISSGHVLPAFQQENSTVNINLAPNSIELPTIPNKSAFSKLRAEIKNRFLKKTEEVICYSNGVNGSNEKCKEFRKSIRSEEREENSETKNFEIVQSQIKEENKTPNNELPR